LVWPLPAIAAIIIVTVEPWGAASDLYASAYLTHGSGHPRSLESFFFWATGADLSRRSGSLVRTHSRCTGPRMDATHCLPVFAGGFNHQTKGKASRINGSGGKFLDSSMLFSSAALSASSR
jgi:hypothetical protein